MPSVTQIVWPCGCVCHAVRAPGVKWTAAAPIADASDGAVIVSMKTVPVNQSPGPRFVSSVFRVICIALSSQGWTMTLRVLARHRNKPKRGAEMKIRTRMCMSVDGYVTTPDGRPAQLAYEGWDPV